MVIRSRTEHRPTFSRPPASSVYRKIAFSFIGMTLLVAIGALWVSSVYARVTIKVKRETTNLETSVDVAKSPEQGELRGQTAHGVFEKIQEFAVKEEKETPADAIVNGTVKIINNYSRPQTLVQNTRLLTADGKLYRIDKTVNLDPKESILVTAHSDQAGQQYAIPAGVKMTIPGLWIDLQKWIYAETNTAFTAGTRMARVVSATDIAEAQKNLDDAVFEQARKTLDAEAKATAGWKVVYIKNIVDKKSNVSPGQSTDQFLASVKMDVTAVYYPEKDMEVLIRQKLKEKLPEGRELVDFDPSLVVYKVEKADVTLERAKISVSVQTPARLTDQSPQLSKEGMLGLSDEKLREKLLSIDGVENVDIRIRPSWIHKMPSSKEKIEIVVE